MAATGFSGEAPPLLGEVLVQQQLVDAPLVDAALVRQQEVRNAKVAESSLIRVDAAKLDELINLVGELIIAGAGAQLEARRFKAPKLVEATGVLSRLVEDVRDSALTLRMGLPDQSAMRPTQWPQIRYYWQLWLALLARRRSGLARGGCRAGLDGHGLGPDRSGRCCRIDRGAGHPARAAGNRGGGGLAVLGAPAGFPALAAVRALGALRALRALRARSFLAPLAALAALAGLADLAPGLHHFTSRLRRLTA